MITIFSTNMLRQKSYWIWNFRFRYPNLGYREPIESHIFGQIVGGIDYLQNTMHILHRDIKVILKVNHEFLIILQNINICLSCKSLLNSYYWFRMRTLLSTKIFMLNWLTLGQPPTLILFPTHLLALKKENCFLLFMELLSIVHLKF